MSELSQDAGAGEQVQTNSDETAAQVSSVNPNNIQNPAVVRKAVQADMLGKISNLLGQQISSLDDLNNFSFAPKQVEQPKGLTKTALMEAKYSDLEQKFIKAEQKAFNAQVALKIGGLLDNVDPDFMDYAKSKITPYIKQSEDGDLYVVDQFGEPKYENGRLVTPEQFAQSVLRNNPKLLKVTPQAGTGGRPSQSIFESSEPMATDYESRIKRAKESNAKSANEDFVITRSKVSELAKAFNQYN